MYRNGCHPRRFQWSQYELVGGKTFWKHYHASRRCQEPTMTGYVVPIRCPEHAWRPACLGVAMILSFAAFSLAISQPFSANNRVSHVSLPRSITWSGLPNACLTLPCYSGPLIRRTETEPVRQSSSTTCTSIPDIAAITESDLLLTLALSVPLTKTTGKFSIAKVYRPRPRNQTSPFLVLSAKALSSIRLRKSKPGHVMP
ncbi:hypothetical protein EDB81DRAFT_790038 [Dactylonectria macrodidyma]|uniref:Uncharacterized protein n=1 Tax=Dactylonectria macrodidyma TaxID=307937 RepID=A0A9P9F5A4_9HYPO|nr:hypothetical protein EDB81DRAFT_790038 [Dactylonectria macrodidyma]